jgi:AcrR family transcriptional regulator
MSTETETRRKVLLATAELLDRLSYGAVTIDAVVRASGVSRSTIYRYWSSRQQLVLDAFALKTDEQTKVEDTGDALADLRTYLSRLAFCLEFGGAASIVAGLIADAGAPGRRRAGAVDALYGALHHRLLVTRQPIDDRFLTGLHAVAVSGLQPS